MKLIKLITLILLAFMGMSCETNGFPIYVPGSSHTSEEEEEETVDIIKPGGPPDFTLLTASNHPRIIFSQADFDAIRTSLTSNHGLKLVHDEIMKNAIASVGKPDLVHKLEGKRLLSVSRDALKRIASCAYAYKVTGEAKYLTQAEHDINTVCAFPDWNAAKHWLDVGEMATGVALGYDWLYSELSDITKTKVIEAIKKFCFTPANNKQWNLNFYAASNNWNQVCNGGIIAAALAIFEKEASCQAMIEKSISSNVGAVEAMYAPDGNYPEGYSYWNYGTLYQALINTMLETAVSSDASLSSQPGFKRTGQYMLFMEGPSSQCFNYSDCAPNTTACLAQWYFAWKYNDVSHLFLEKNRISRYASSAESRLLPLIAYYAHKLKISSLDDLQSPKDLVWSGNGDTPVILAHSNWKNDATDSYLGVKGGKANTSHAHMDAGSFVYDAMGLRWSSDLGLQSYGTLEPYINLWSMHDGAERWKVFRLKNTSHSTITINDAPHRVGGSAVINSVFKQANKLGGIIDMTEVMKDQASRVTRTIYMENGDLIVQDEITARSDKAAKVRWNMVTQAKPTIEYGSITLTQSGKTMYLKKSSSTGHNVAWKTWSAEGKMSYDAPNPGYYMCGYEVTINPSQTANITIILTPNE